MKYLIVDDHAMLAGALKFLIESKDAEAQVLTTGEAPEALEILKAHGDEVDLLILDLNLPGVTGTDLLETIVANFPSLKILVVSGETDKESIMKVLSLGAAGFVPKSLEPQTLSNAIDFVLQGGVFIPTLVINEGQRAGFFNETARKILPQAEPVHLTDRQQEVLMHLAKGSPIKRICLDLNLSEGTVKTHVAAIYRAFGASNRTEALVAARRAGFDIDL